MGCASTAVPLTDEPQAWLINNQSRLHLQHGPIDLIIQAEGSEQEIQRAYQQATRSFKRILSELSSQLSLLRAPFCDDNSAALVGPVAKRMVIAVRPYRRFNVTPMIAVAGAVADYVLSCMTEGRTLRRVQVNNGGDIAIHLNKNVDFKIGICADPNSTKHTDVITIRGSSLIRGVATSGWQGRSHSLGIANAVTVLAQTASQADVAASLIANSVDLPGCSKVIRQPADQLDPQSDLGDRLVTVHVKTLNQSEKLTALINAEKRAKNLISEGLISSCYINIQGLVLVIDSNKVSPLMSLSH